MKRWSIKTPTRKNAKEEDEEKKASSMNTGADGRRTQLVFVAGVVGPALGARPAVPCQGATGARVGCPPSSDGVQGWLLRRAVDAGWLICVASTFKVPLETRLGGGWWEKNAASSKPEIDEAGRQDYRESTVSYRGPFSTVECFLLSTSRFQTWSFETCAGIVLIVCQRIRLAVSGTGSSGPRRTPLRSAPHC